MTLLFALILHFEGVRAEELFSWEMSEQFCSFVERRSMASNMGLLLVLIMKSPLNHDNVSRA